MSTSADWTLPPDRVEVWWCPVREASSRLEKVLSPDELLRAARFRSAGDRDRYVTARSLVRVLLGRYLDRDPATIEMAARCTECEGNHGKPCLADGDVEFSVSHSAQRVGVAIARTPVGIDVEELRRGRVDPDLAAEVLAPDELEVWERLADPGAGLVRWWTRKEAVLKASGLGLSAPPQRLRVSAPDEPARVLAWPDGGGAYQLRDLHPAAGYLGALAVQTDVPPAVRERDAAQLLGG